MITHASPSPRSSTRNPPVFPSRPPGSCRGAPFLPAGQSPGTSRFPPLYTTGYHRGMLPVAPRYLPVAPWWSSGYPFHHSPRYSYHHSPCNPPAGPRYLPVSPLYTTGYRRGMVPGFPRWLPGFPRWLQVGIGFASGGRLAYSGGYRYALVGFKGGCRYALVGFEGLPGDRTGRLRWVARGGYRGVPGDEK